MQRPDERRGKSKIRRSFPQIDRDTTPLQCSSHAAEDEQAAREMESDVHDVVPADIDAAQRVVGGERQVHERPARGGDLARCTQCLCQ